MEQLNRLMQYLAELPPEEFTPELEAQLRTMSEMAHIYPTPEA